MFVLLADSSTVVLLVLLAGSTSTSSTTITGYRTEKGAGGGEGGRCRWRRAGAGGGERMQVEQRGEVQVAKEEVAVEVKVTGFIWTYSPRKNNKTALHRGWATQSPARLRAPVDGRPPTAAAAEKNGGPQVKM